MRRLVTLGVASEINAARSFSWTQRSPNSPTSRRLSFESALSDVEVAIDAGRARRAQDSVRRALELIHELDDSCRRGEWAQTEWTPDESNAWTAHIGARNAVHHHSSADLGVAALHSRDQRDKRLTWEIDPSAITGMSSYSRYGPIRAREYNARLAGKPVLPGLRHIATLLERSIP